MGLPLPDDASAGPELAAEYAAAREREGRVMAILRALGPRAEVLRAFLELADAVLYGPAALGRRERELLALATSETNGADYSAGVHATLLSELGDAGEHDAALRAFARRVTLAPAEAESSRLPTSRSIKPGRSASRQSTRQKVANLPGYDRS